MADIELHKKIFIFCSRSSNLQIKTKSKRHSVELRAAKKKIATSEFLNTVENCSTAAKILMHIQWRENNKKKKK